jgi:3-phenylpropionate/trans-cinnamate dioxygenase ferredoxin subunit
VSHDVCAAADLDPGMMVETTIGERAIVVARSAGGRLHAFSARCLHHGAPLARGRLLAGVEGAAPGDYRLDGCHEIVKCPWHGYEYELASGAALFDRRRRLRVFTAYERDGRIMVDPGGRSGREERSGLAGASP